MSSDYHRYLDREHPSTYRAAEREALNRAVRARENRLVIGVPGMGVSNLLRFWVARPDPLPVKAIYAYATGDELAGEDPDDLCQELARQLIEQRLLDEPNTVHQGYDWLRRALRTPPREAQDRIVLVIDQCDALVSAVDASFYRRLKALTDLNKRVCIILTTTPGLATAVDPHNLLFAGRRLFVGPLTVEDAVLAVREEEARLGVRWDSSTVRRLVWLTGGHPGLLRAVSSATADDSLDRLAADEAWLERLLCRDDISYRCTKILLALDPELRNTLTALARTQMVQCADAHDAQLHAMGLIARRTGRPQLFSPLFARVLAQQAGEEDEIRIEHPSVVVHHGREIVVAGMVVFGPRRIHLSPLELRLFACLQRDRRIYTKDELIACVYFDETNWDEAIADSRIENLIRQLRARLPDRRHIKTHRGMGYEFVPDP